MTNHFGVNVMQARIASLSAKRVLTREDMLELVTKIKKTGVGEVPVNRSQRRFEERKKRKSA